MSRRDRIQHRWTHRRLGIGAERSGELAMAETDAMLTRVGARRAATTSTFVDADPMSAALLDFVCDIDLVAGIAAVDATPVAAELLRLNPVRRRARRLTWRVVIPAMSGSLAALVVALAILLVRTSSTPAPSLSATAESRQLLSHADNLLTAAAAATAPADRTRLVREARADLRHVSHLLPLAPPPDRSGIRRRLHALDHRVAPLAPPAHQSSSTGTDTTGAGTPPHRHSPVRRPPAPDTNSGRSTQTSGESTGTNTPPDATDPEPATRPTGTGVLPSQGSGEYPPPPGMGQQRPGSQPPPPDSQSVP